MDPNVVLQIMMGVFALGAAGLIGRGILRSGREGIERLKFPGLQPIEPGKDLRYFEHEGVECGVRVPSPGIVELSRDGVPSTLAKGDTLIGKSTETGFEWNLPDEAQGLVGYAAGRALLEAARTAGRGAEVFLVWNGVLRVRVRGPRGSKLPGLAQAMTALVTELGLEPRMGLEALELPALPDGANAPSGASVGAPGWKP